MKPNTLLHAGLLLGEEVVHAGGVVNLDLGVDLGLLDLEAAVEEGDLGVLDLDGHAGVH